MSDTRQDDLTEVPSYHGEKCPYNGENGLEIRCDECDNYITCFPDWKEHI